MTKEEAMELLNKVNKKSERDTLVEERVKKMEYDVTVDGFTVKSGVPTVFGKYDFSRPDYFFYEYLNGLDGRNQDWQIDEYEKLNKKVYKLLTRYVVNYANSGYDKNREKAKQELLTGYYRRMMVLCLEKDMSFDEYIDMSEEDFFDLTEGRVYTFTLHDYWLNDMLGINVELFRKLRFDSSYMFY